MAPVLNENRLASDAVEDQIMVRQGNPHKDTRGIRLRSDARKRAQPIYGCLDRVSHGDRGGRVDRDASGNIPSASARAVAV
jgi:hypothetical protein